MKSIIAELLEAIRFEVRTLFRAAIRRPPDRPADWTQQGWDSAKNEDYAAWFTSATRLLLRLLTYTPGLAMLYVVLFLMVLGKGGMGDVGSSALFMDEGSWWWTFLSGGAFGLLLFHLCFVSMLLWSREWMQWWQPLGKLRKTQDRFFHQAFISIYFSRVLWLSWTILAICLIFWPKNIELPTRCWFGASVIMVSSLPLALLIKFVRTGAYSRRGATPRGGPLVEKLGYKAENLFKSKWLRWAESMTERMLRHALRVPKEEALNKEVLHCHTFATIIVMVLGLGGIGACAPNLAAWLPTSILLCLLTAQLANVYGFLSFHRLTSRWVIVPLLALGLLHFIGMQGGYRLINGNKPTYLHSLMDFERDDSRSASPHSEYLQPFRWDKDPNNLRLSEATLPPKTQGLANNEVIKNWADAGDRIAGPKPRLIVLAVSGGGIRAAAWTTRVIQFLEKTVKRELQVSFMRHVRLITGASGGMVGAAYCVGAYAKDVDSLTKDALLDGITADSLNPSVRWLVMRDAAHTLVRPLPDMLWRRIIGRGFWDRGEALQQAWEKSTGGILGLRLGELREQERTGKIPSLLFSPMIVEDGRQLLITNLNVEQLESLDFDGDGLADSRAALSLRALFPQHIDRVRLSTAARLSASFPYVSPAAQLPTDPPIRLVDAGYFDNFGVKLATNWLIQNAGEIAEYASGIIIVQIRDGVAVDDLEQYQQTSRGRTWGGFSGLTSPLEGMLKARGSVRAFDNDALLFAARHLIRREHDLPCDVVTFEFPGEAALSWQLTGTEKEEIEQGIQDPTRDAQKRALRIEKKALDRSLPPATKDPKILKAFSKDRARRNNTIELSNLLLLLKGQQAK